MTRPFEDDVAFEAFQDDKAFHHSLFFLIYLCQDLAAIGIGIANGKVLQPRTNCKACIGSAKPSSLPPIKL